MNDTTCFCSQNLGVLLLTKLSVAAHLVCSVLLCSCSCPSALTKSNGSLLVTWRSPNLSALHLSIRDDAVENAFGSRHDHFTGFFSPSASPSNRLAVTCCIVSFYLTTLHSCTLNCMPVSSGSITRNRRRLPINQS